MWVRFLQRVQLLGCRITVITSDFGPDYGGSIPLGPTKYRKIFFLNSVKNSDENLNLQKI